MGVTADQPRIDSLYIIGDLLIFCEFFGIIFAQRLTVLYLLLYLNNLFFQTVNIPICTLLPLFIMRLYFIFLIDEIRFFLIDEIR